MFILRDEFRGRYFLLPPFFQISSLSLSLSSSKYVGFLIHAVEATIGIVCKMRFVIRTLIIAVTGKEICPTSEIVFLPVLIFTYSHVENALFFA
jgi:hypothetical protein